MTVDPFDAKDYDDAISISPGPQKGQISLGVHIAEVAAWIHPGSKWDRAARERSFTAYLPGKTMPMLPRTLTGLISLTPDRKSPAHSVFFTVDSASGRILSSRRCHSWINITKRLNFDELQSFIDGGSPEGWDKSLCEKMDSLVKLTRVMRALRRKEEHFLDIATPEIRVICDDATKTISGISRKFQRESDQLVEDCMLAANTEVAKELIEKNIPGVFRVHEEPDPLRIEEFSAFIEGTFGLSTGDLSSGRIACNHFLNSLPADHRKPVIMAAFLRALPRAHYIAEPALHYGLGKERYSHFTSPIRRYPDLLVHQQLWQADTNGKLHSKITLAKHAETCSKKEENNDDAFYAANDRLKLQYLRQITDEENPQVHEGIITKVSSGGLLVDITDLGIFGFVPVEMLSAGRFLYSKQKGRIHAERGHQQYKCGDFIYLRLDHIDMARGSAIFRPIQAR